MDIEKIIEELQKNRPNAQWQFLEMEIESTFPTKNRFHESMWASWLSKIQDGEKADSSFLAKKQADIEDYYKSDEAQSNDFDPGEILADEAYEAFTVSNNIYAALVVSIWTKCEKNLKCISTLCAEQLKIGIPKFDFDNQKNFYKKQFKIAFAILPKYAEINAIRLLNNIYKHADGYCNETRYNQITKTIAAAWNVEKKKQIDYTTLPIETIVYSCNEFFTKLLEETKKETTNQRK
jgi:hypothetical protein